LSSPLIWIFLPAVISILLWLIPLKLKLRLGLGIACAFGLGVLARFLPIGSSFHFGPWSTQVGDTLSILGRTLTLNDADKPMLILFYLLTALWFLGGFVVKTSTVMAPLGLAVVALLVAALSVQPFLFGALLIEMAVIVSVLMLAPPGETPGQGVLHYLIFQTLGVPFILFTGWMLNGIEAGSGGPNLILRATVMLGLGFAFLLAIFPFNTWLPLLTGQAEPYVTGFILVMLPMTVLLFAMNFLDLYAWLRDEPTVYMVLRLVGALMVVSGGIWAAFQRHLGRILGYVIIVETGMALLAVGLRAQGGFQIFAAQFLPRAIGIWFWSLALASLRQKVGGLDFDSARGKLHAFPFSAGSLLVAQFSLAGLPLLANFPFQSSLLTAIYQQSSVTAYWVFAGSLGILLAGLRSLNALAVKPGFDTWTIGERRWEAVLFCLGALFILALGFFPQWFLPTMLNLLKAYTHF
jgi:NADH-quinone oxidoreductase subunit N